MIGISYFLDRLRDVKLKDYLSIFPMSVAIMLRPFYKRKFRGSWLVCEEAAEARDNGYHFFKYMCINQPQQKCYYAIKKGSVDYKKVADLGETIEYGSIQHWLAYFLCEYNISSQKGGKPNAAMCAFMEMIGRFKPQNVFLQHGITKDHAKWLYADKCNFKYFITAAIPENEMIKRDYGYPEGTVQLTGFARYDALDSNDTNKNQVLIMPTWRNWFNLRSKGGNDVSSDFDQSVYLRKWTELLESKILLELIDEHSLEVIFFLHRNMQRYINAFENINKKIIIASWKEYDIQTLLKKSAIMITDYSSVYFDMIYMKKPIIFYQFDELEYRRHQYQQGWFDYHNNPCGKAYDNFQGVIEELKRYISMNMQVSSEYLDFCEKIFLYSDNNNAYRIYKLLVGEHNAGF